MQLYLVKLCKVPSFRPIAPLRVALPAQGCFTFEHRASTVAFLLYLLEEKLEALLRNSFFPEGSENRIPPDRSMNLLGAGNF